MPMSIRCVSLKALHRSHSPRSETPDSLWHGRLLKDEGGLLSHARLTRTDRGGPGAPGPDSGRHGENQSARRLPISSLLVRSAG